MKALLLTGALALLFAAFIVLPDYGRAQQASQDICRFFFNNTKIRDPESCSNYITCIDFVSHYTACKGSTPFYDKNTAACVKTLSDDSSCEVDCTESVGRFLPDPKSCKGYYWCKDETSSQYGICPDTTHFNSTQQSCIYKYESECRVNNFDFCSLVKDSVNFNDESGCDKYFVCSKGNQTSKSCITTSSSQYYNPVTGKCGQKSMVPCAAHTLPKSVCGTDKSPKKNVFVEDGATCRGYFYCAHPNLSETGTGADPKPRWGQCEKGKFFHAKTQKCVDPLEVKCNWDRCDGRPDMTFVSATTKGCREYNRCRNEISVEKLSCGNRFFDERQGSCVSNIVTYTSCAT